MALECKLVSYDPETCRLVGEIINVSADESIIGEDGKIDPNGCSPSSLIRYTINIGSSGKWQEMHSEMD